MRLSRELATATSEGLAAKPRVRLTVRVTACLLLALATGVGVCAGVLFLAEPGAAYAEKNVPHERIVEGKVINRDGDPLGGAVVYLQDAQTSGIKTYIADDDGHYRFGNLSREKDYQLWAQSNGVRSKSREISSFDSSDKFYITLKVDIAKPVSLDGPAVPGTYPLP
ncbi:MAG: carboxypeptidase-like regulatory domain-containing protein [Acidobacteriaceae bacterium]